MLHVLGNSELDACEINNRIDELNRRIDVLCSSVATASTQVVPLSMPLVPANYEADGVHLSRHGCEQLIGQLLYQVPALQIRISSSEFARSTPPTQQPQVSPSALGLTSLPLLPRLLSSASSPADREALPVDVTHQQHEEAGIESWMLTRTLGDSPTQTMRCAASIAASPSYA